MICDQGASRSPRREPGGAWETSRRRSPRDCPRPDRCPCDSHSSNRRETIRLADLCRGPCGRKDPGIRTWLERWRQAEVRPLPAPLGTTGGTASADREAHRILAGPSKELGGPGFWRHVFPQLFEGGALQSRDVHLADAKPARDLRL